MGVTFDSPEGGMHDAEGGKAERVRGRLYWVFVARNNGEKDNRPYRIRILGLCRCDGHSTHRSLISFLTYLIFLYVYNSHGDDA